MRATDTIMISTNIENGYLRRSSLINFYPTPCIKILVDVFKEIFKIAQSIRYREILINFTSKLVYGFPRLKKNNKNTRPVEFF